MFIDYSRENSFSDTTSKRKVFFLIKIITKLRSRGGGQKAITADYSFRDYFYPRAINSFLINYARLSIELFN